jgi:hypothetical protein
VPLRNLSVFYPVHNFQYLHIRILEQDKPPLKVEGVLCYPPAAEDGHTRTLEARIVENRGDATTGKTTILADLGERRFPVAGLTISTPTKEFTKKVTVSGASSSSAESWKKLHDGAVFRLISEGALEERIKVRLQPSGLRYLKLELAGKGTPPVTVDRLNATGTARFVVFNHRRGNKYQLFYDNTQATGPATDTGMISIKGFKAADSSAELLLGPEQKNTAPPKPVQSASPAASDKSSVRLVAGIIMVLVGLLLLFSLMLKARAWREGRRPPRGLNTRI